jgi:hypothetical protein
MIESQHAPSSRGAHLRAKLAAVRGNTRKKHARAFIALYRPSADYAQDELTFATVAATPDWVLADQTQRDIIAKVAALLYHREGVDAEIDGNRLAALSQMVGEDIFDALCDCALPVAKAEGRHLPRPDNLSAIGHELMSASLPAALSAQFPSAKSATDLADLCNIAAEIVANHTPISCVST